MAVPGSKSPGISPAIHVFLNRQDAKSKESAHLTRSHGSLPLRPLGRRGLG